MQFFKVTAKKQVIAKTHLEPSQTTKMGLFMKIVGGIQP